MTADQLNALLAERNRAHEAFKELSDREPDPAKRSEELKTSIERADADVANLGVRIDEALKALRYERENDIARDAINSLVKPADDEARSLAQVSAIERFFRTGDTTGLTVERDGARSGVVVDLAPAARLSQAIRSGMDAREARTLLTDTGTSGSLVPTTFVASLYQYMEASSAIRRLSTVLTTASGENMDFPKVGTHAIATQVIAQGTAIGGTDPTFDKITLGAFKYGELVQLSNEAIQDSGIDILSFIAANVGRAIGRKTDTAYVTGAGSTSGPNGIVTAAGTGVKTGGSLISLTLENLIDLQHSVVDEYRNSPSAAFVMNDSTAGTLRKIREDAGGTTGQFLWQPAIVLGQPDMVLGKPAYTDTNFAAQGSAARAVAFGDWSAYYIRDVQGVRFERSDDYAFNTDLVSFRGVLRTDADLIDANAIKTTSQLP